MSTVLPLAVKVFALSLTLLLASFAHAVPSQCCRCFPGDDCWPSRGRWDAFNRTVGGRLIATVPIAASCHDSDLAPYDAAACEALQSTWWFPETHLVTSSSPMAPFFANSSCDPFTARDDQCVIGAYVQYAVKATGLADYQATLKFATENNIRLVIRNTGHDYYGKSTGAGALALWTHHLKDIKVVDKYQSTAYTGKAMKFGAGVELADAYKAASDAGLAVVGGACATVGISGGFTQGGGHGPLNSRFGLGSDQVLEWEVVTAQGRHLVASPTQNTDLYWALSGGGGGTYAAVLSVTVRAHVLTTISAASLTFTSSGVSDETFYKAFKAFLLSLPKAAQGGTWASWILSPGYFSVSPIVGPELSGSELQALLDPTLASLNESGIAFDYNIQTFTSLYDTYTTMFPRNNITAYNIGGRLIPKSVLATETSTDEFLDTLRYFLDQGVIVSGSSLDVSGFPLGVDNAINPVWRDTILSIVVGLAYNAFDFNNNIELQKKMTDVIMPRLKELTPGGGSYSNEADLNDPDWREAFYGNNYDRLKAIKDKWDPKQIFYGKTAVGSNRWALKEDGRLCRASA